MDTVRACGNALAFCRNSLLVKDLQPFFVWEMMALVRVYPMSLSPGAEELPRRRPHSIIWRGVNFKVLPTLVH